MTEQLKPIQPQINEVQQIDLLTNPEEGENFAGQEVLVIGGSDAHGISMAVASAQYLAEKGASVAVYVGSPVIREGKEATYTRRFYTQTLPSISLAGFDRAVIADIPYFNKDVAASEAQLIALSQRLVEDREKRGLPKIDNRVFFLDHHNLSAFQPAQGEASSISTIRNIEPHGIVIKTTQTAEACHLGGENSFLTRIGAIADRDPSVLPVTDEEMQLAHGLDIAIRPDPTDLRPEQPRSEQEAWEERVRARLKIAIDRLANGDWEYFREEAVQAPIADIPIASGFGHIAIVDTQGLTISNMVLKYMESALEQHNVATMPYAIAVQRNVRDERMGREPADIISLIRHWTREDLPSVKDVIHATFSAELAEQLEISGHPNAISIRLPVDDRHTADIATSLVEAFAGTEMPDFSNIRSVVICGDPNSGKSVFSSIFREALKTLGVNVQHLDLDKAAPTPPWYLDAEIAYKEAEQLFAQGKITNAELAEKRQQLAEVAASRKAMKRPWSINLAEAAKQELIAAADPKKGADFVIGDIGGGRIIRDPDTGKIVHIQRLTAENARILEGADAVIIVSNNPEGMDAWRQLIDSGVDEATGVRINRDTPIEIIGMYQSVLEGSVQRVPGSSVEAGVVTNLDRSKAERIYNPTIFTTAMFISEAVEKRKKNGHEPEQVQSWKAHMAYGSERFASVTANNHNIVLFGEGPGVQKIVLGKDVVLVLPQNPEQLSEHAPYPTHQEAWLPMWFVLLRHSQHRTPEELAYKHAINERLLPENRELVRNALIYKANEFWQSYQADTVTQNPRKRYKQLTRIMQDILLYVDAPETVIEDQQAYLIAHPLYPLIEQANKLRKGEDIGKAAELEEQVKDVLAAYTEAVGYEEAKKAYETLQANLTRNEQDAMVVIMPDASIADVAKAAGLVRYDLLMSEDEHDQDVISIVSDPEPTFQQVDTRSGSQLARKRRMDVIAVPSTLGPWDIVRDGKDSYQPIGMIVATHTTPRNETGRQMQARLQAAFTPELIAHHYLGAAEEFLHREAWGKSYVRRIDREDVPHIKKAIPLYRVACDLLPRAVYMLKTGQYPAGVANEELWEIGETAAEAAKIEDIFARQDATQEELIALARALEEKFSRWFVPEDYQFFLDNMAKMGKDVTKESTETNANQ